MVRLSRSTSLPTAGRLFTFRTPSQLASIRAGSGFLHHAALTAALFACLLPAAAVAQNYSVNRDKNDRGDDVIKLVDNARGEQVSLVPSRGNKGVGFKVHGKDVIWPAGEHDTGLSGIPFLAPWANRLDEAGFWSNGHHYVFNPSLGNFSSDGNGLPIHGLLMSSNLWKIVDTSADDDGASVTCRLEFWKYPELMAQWPFAQEYDMTYRLSKGELEVRTSIRNLGTESIPVSIGFHPYYHLPGIDRSEWTLTMPQAKAVVTDKRLIPTGEFKPNELPNPLPMKGHILDDGFTDLSRDADGRAHFHLASGSEAIDVTFGPKFQVAVLWEPPPHTGWDPQFVCIEPMAAVTDGINLNHLGKYSPLQSVAPGQTWTESFWVKPSGI